MSDSTHTTALPDANEDVFPIDYDEGGCEITAHMTGLRDQTRLIQLALQQMKASGYDETTRKCLIGLVEVLEDDICKVHDRLTGFDFDAPWTDAPA
jgi:hypothetical protein